MKQTQMKEHELQRTAYSSGASRPRKVFFNFSSLSQPQSSFALGTTVTCNDEFRNCDANH
jgi:hypothetical protein